MATVCIRTVATDAEARAGLDYPARYLQAAAARDRFGTHRVTSNFREADAIIFAESHRDGTPAGLYLERVLADPVYRERPDICAIHLGVDRPVPLLPGIYPSVEARWQPAGVKSGSYLVERNPFLQYDPTRAVEDAEWLGSFLGSMKEVRRPLLDLRDDRLLVGDRGSEFVAALRAGDTEAVNRLKADYIETSQNSKFVLCPRGTGTSSIRLFETLELGRAPVIISDQWVPPEGPDWKTCSLRVRESEIACLGQILREREREAAAMGQAARRIWEDWYADDAIFHRLVEDCLDCLRRRRGPQWFYRYRVSLQLLRPLHARTRLRSLRQAFKGSR